MKETLIALLGTLKYPVKLQGTITKDEAYPASFFTIWNTETIDGHHYDNGPISVVWEFSIFFFSTDPTLVNTVLDEAIALLKTNGWIITGRGYDAPSDEASHTGRAFDALYIDLQEV